MLKAIEWLTQDGVFLKIIVFTDFPNNIFLKVIFT